MVPASTYDSILVVSFGGPEKPEDVIPFLENVLRGRDVPRDRLLAVAEHYYHFGGRSPINDQNRALIAALQLELRRHGPDLPVYWGNRNWHPLLADTLRNMADDGRQHALAFVTSAFSSYSGCRQYREDIGKAQALQTAGKNACPTVAKLRVFYNHPLFVEVMAANVQRSLEQVPNAALLYTAHSIPLSMAQTCAYEQQLLEACRLVSTAVGRSDWKLVYQSRSGSPTQPWLGPDITEALREVRSQGVTEAVVVPIGFVSDHMEVLYDLDTEAQAVAEQIGLHMVRAATAGAAPKFIAMIRDLIVTHSASHDMCPEDCCPAPRRPTL